MPTLMYVAAMAFIQKENTLLLVKRHPNHPNGDGGIWEMPGGHIEAGETFEEGLLREVKEESNLTVRIVAPLSTWIIEARPLVGVTFVCDYLEGDVKLTQEHTEFQWVDFEKLLDYIKKPSMINDIRIFWNWKKKVNQ